MQALFLLITVAVLVAVLLADIATAIFDPDEELPDEGCGTPDENSQGDSPAMPRQRPARCSCSPSSCSPSCRGCSPGTTDGAAYPRNLEASTAHLLALPAGPDTFAQAVYGTRQVLEIAFGAGWRARCWPRSSAWRRPTSAADGRGVKPVQPTSSSVIPLFPLLIGSRHVHNSARRAERGADTSPDGPTPLASCAPRPWPLRSRTSSRRPRYAAAAIYVIVVEILPTMTSLLVAAFLHHGAVRRAVRVQPAVHRARATERDRMGHHALLGAEQRGPADRVLPAGDRARRAIALLARVRATQLRLRRDWHPRCLRAAKHQAARAVGALCAAPGVWG